MSDQKCEEGQLVQGTEPFLTVVPLPKQVDLFTKL